MKDDLDSCSEGQGGMRGIHSLAESALKILADNRHGERQGVTGDWVERLCDAVVSDSETSHHRVISAMVSSGIRSDDIFDIYLPAVARELGERWMRDEATFVEVTLGTGRLQTLLRERAERGRGGAEAASASSVLLVLPPFEAHALGVFIAADQFRRLGHSVQVAVAPSAAELGRLLDDREFAMLGLTCATRRAIPELREYVAAIRAQARSVPPVVIGGPLVASTPNLAETIGADRIAATCQDALAACGLVSEPEALCIEGQP